MRYRQLGASDLEVSEISLGSWLTYGVGVERDQARGVRRRRPSTSASTSSTRPTSTAAARPRSSSARCSRAGRATPTCSRRSSTSRCRDGDQRPLARAGPQADRRARCSGCAPTTSTSTSATATTRTRRSRRRWRRSPRSCARARSRYLGFSEWTPEQIQAALDARPASRSSSPASRSTRCSGACPSRR